jgi:magnesium transporter
MDQVVDEYAPVVEDVESEVQDVEQAVFAPERENPAERIVALDRDVLEFHRDVSPLIEPVHRLARGDFSPMIDEHLKSYFRDVHDHLIRVVSHVHGMRELLGSALQANLTQVTVHQNEDMRKISAWVAILAVPTMVAGIYGMNFDTMPELRWRYGYPAVIGIVLVACGLLYRRFKRSGWL